MLRLSAYNQDTRSASAVLALLRYLATMLDSRWISGIDRLKTLDVRTLMLAFLLLTIRSTAPGQVTSSETVDRIKQAVAERLCYEIYWNDRHYRQGQPLKIKLFVCDQRFGVRVADLQVDPNGTSWFGRYEGIESGGIVSVTTSSSFPMSATAGEAFNDFDSEVSCNDSFEDTLTLPLSCEPGSSMTQEKRGIVDNIVGTVRQLRAVREQEHEELKLRIGDFNADYPGAFVLVEPWDEVFQMAIHDPDGEDDARYQLSGYYLFRELNQNERQFAKARILKHNIMETIE